MTATITVKESSLLAFEGNVSHKLDSLKQHVQGAMADAYHGVVMANFGTVGFDRPWQWPRLSSRYSKRVGRKVSTLFVTGALKASVQKDNSNPQAATVSMGGVIALSHHYGAPSINLPARRVFPMKADGTPMERTAKLIVRAAKDAVKEAL